jgi:hypothetical protein
MNAYWISYYVPEDRMKDFELHSPWWISGETMEDRIRVTVVAAVRAMTEAAAAKRFRDAFDSRPEFEERFITEVDGRGWSPFSDRFPQAEWMAWTDDATCACGQPNCDGR